MSPRSNAMFDVVRSTAVKTNVCGALSVLARSMKCTINIYNIRRWAKGNPVRKCAFAKMLGGALSVLARSMKCIISACIFAALGKSKTTEKSV